MTNLTVAVKKEVQLDSQVQKMTRTAAGYEVMTMREATLLFDFTINKT
jgi:hypothetical protein